MVRNAVIKELTSVFNALTQKTNAAHHRIALAMTCVARTASVAIAAKVLIVTPANARNVEMVSA